MTKYLFEIIFPGSNTGKALAPIDPLMELPLTTICVNLIQLKLLKAIPDIAAGNKVLNFYAWALVLLVL